MEDFSCNDILNYNENIQLTICLSVGPWCDYFLQASYVQRNRTRNLIYAQWMHCDLISAAHKRHFLDMKNCSGD